MNQRLIRFDVRLHKDDYVGTFWDKANREQFLLDSAIEWPLSVDPLVWPSVFFSGIFRDKSKFPYGNVEVDPAIDGGNYWLNLEQMKAHYEAHRLPNTKGIMVALHLFADQSLSEDIIPYTLSGGIECALSLGRTIPDALRNGWEFLGFDVADAGLVSGLTNCAYDPVEKKRLARVWAPRLNSFGLMEDIECATEFKYLCDEREPGHSPFWVYGISRLP